MKGSIHQKANGQWYVAWYHDGHQHKIYRYQGDMIESRRVAEKLRSLMQSDTEKGVFRIETYTKEQWTDTSEYLTNWLESIKPSVSLATYRNYKTSITKHLTPFFQKHRIKLKEIQYDILVMLLNSIDLTGQGKICIMKCLQTCLKHAWRSQRIPNMPPFPDRKMYRIEAPEIRWISEERQMAIIDAVPERHRPIFLWLKYHLRRPAEAMSLLKTDYDPGTKSFTIHRSVSSHKQVDRTKTGKVHVIPCHSAFAPHLNDLGRSFSQYLFSCRESQQPGKCYTQHIMSGIWKAACSEAGENIPMYAGLKHSSCCQYINEKGLSLSELQSVTDHASMDSVKRYAKMEIDRKRELMERTGKVIPIKEWLETQNQDAIIKLVKVNSVGSHKEAPY
ncbi:MAG: tyrosine-type recombinase/integrase [Deltaproteobacteria bacterium]|nr:tyrosine-type recombinase/integrase [Deltaproteobacteria bacterium]